MSGDTIAWYPARKNQSAAVLEHRGVVRPMFIAAHHTIHDPARFWREVQANRKPADIKVLKIMRNEAGDRAAILWEAESVEALEQWFSMGLGNTSEQESSAVDSARDWGL